MGLKFHDGTHKLYKTYTNAKAWNDTGLLRTSAGVDVDLEH